MTHALGTIGRRELPGGPAGSRRRPGLVWAGILALLAGACALWAFSLRRIDLAAISDYGLISSLPATFLLALALLSVSFLLALHAERLPEAVLLAHVVALVLILYGTGPLLYETPRLSWTYKHIGVAEYIQRTGGVEPSISIYFNWPGFFALAALFNQIAGLDSALAYAGWSHVFFELAFVGALLLLFRALSADRRVTWLAIWLFFVTNWVAPDYFAPQSLAYLLYLTLFGLLLNWFKVRGEIDEATVARWRVPRRLVPLAHRLVGYPEHDGAPNAGATPARRVGVMLIVIVLFATIVATHQLTPLVAFLCFAMIVLAARSRALGLPALMAVLTLAWYFYPAFPYTQDELYRFVLPFGRIGENLDRNLADLAAVSDGRAFVALTCRALTLSVWALAVVGAVRRFRAGHADVSCFALAFVPLVLPLLQPYEGEMLFRVYMFTLPFMVWLAAAAIYPSAATPTTRLTTGLAGVLCGLALAAFLIAYYGNERTNYFTADELAAAEWIYEDAPPRSLIVMGSFNSPMEYRDFERHSIVTLAGLDEFRERAPGPADLVEVERVMRWAPSSYLLVTRSQIEYVDLFRPLPAGSLTNLEEALRGSDRFKVAFENRDARVYVLTEP